MKGYVTLFFAVAILLLLIPLPALPMASPSSPPSIHVSAPSADQNPANTTATATTTTIPNKKAAVFRILCGEQVVTLSEREFLIRTLAFEMPALYHTEALKAQAVAAYTYYGRRRAAQQQDADPALKGADFVSPADTFPHNYTTEKLQEVWGNNFTTYYNKLSAAVDAVLGKTITYQGQLIDACYFAISNGSTESADTIWGQDVPYLQAVASPGDCLCADFQTTITMTADQVKTALLAAQPTLTLPEAPAAWFGQPTCSAAGTVISIPVGNADFTGVALRQALGLRSATFTVVWQETQFTFMVKGYGHGVGMSQYGADFLARQGYTWEEILKYYYKGVTVC